MPGASEALAKTWADLLSAAMLRFGITTPARQAMFLAQVGHESGGFSTLVESLNYTPEALRATWPSRFTVATAALYGRTATQQAKQLQMGIAAYGGRMGNAPAPSMDGYNYRGRNQLLDLKEDMRQAGAKMVQREQVKTATQAGEESQQANSPLATMVMDFEDALALLLDTVAACRSRAAHDATSTARTAVAGQHCRSRSA